MGEGKARSVIIGVLGTGVPRLACLRPAAWLSQWPGTVHLHQPNTQDPREGPSLAGRTTQGLLKGGLTRQAREEAERSRRGVPREVPVTQAMAIKTRRAPARVVSSFPLWCKGGKRRHGVPRHQAKVSVCVQRDQDQQSGRTEVTVEPKTASQPEAFRRQILLLSG